MAALPVNTRPGRSTQPDGAGERLQKTLARAGLASRRTIDVWIAAGRVLVNGKPALLGQRVGPQDLIAVDGRPVARTPAAGSRLRVLALNKPAGTVCTRRDPAGRPTVFSLLPDARGARWIAVGRLDVNTTGLLLFTEDGQLAHRLMHPRYEVTREYAVRVFGAVDEAMLVRLRGGVEIDGDPLAFDAVLPQAGSGANQWFSCTLRTGRNREVRRLWESQGVRVSRLIRVRFGNIALPKRVPMGKTAEITGEALAGLYRLVALQPAPATPAPARVRRS